MMQRTSAAALETSATQRKPELRVHGEVPQQNQDGTGGAKQNLMIQVEGLRKTYQTARGALNLFDNLNLEIAAGEMVAVVGQSGAGKSTLLHILGALDAPSAGTVYCASTNVASLSAREAAGFRNREIGYVWQFHYLLPEFTALENVAMPLLARDMAKREALAVAANWLREVGLEERGAHRPGELSGGEQQRVALARAFVVEPPIVMADEPTGNLDSANGKLVLDLLLERNKRAGTTLVLVTHDPEVASRADRKIVLRDGLIVEDTLPSTAPDQEQHG
jgi:lipoprotein-releasing system ATP-binding protein